MNKMRRTLYNRIIHLLRTEPEKWQFTQHAARYETYEGLGIEVWLVNRYYGTRWTYGAIQSGPDGVNTFWFLKPWQWWRVSLIREVEKAQFKLIEQRETEQ